MPFEANNMHDLAKSAHKLNYECPVAECMECLPFINSMSMASSQRSEKAFFYKNGIADSDRTLPNGWQMSKFESIRAGLKHLKVSTLMFSLLTSGASFVSFHGNICKKILILAQ